MSTVVRVGRRQRVIRLGFDTFTEASDTAVASHNPDQAGGWVLTGGTATVIASIDRVRGVNTSNGNRFDWNRRVGPYTAVEADFWLPDVTKPNMFPGLALARPAISDPSGMECSFDTVDAGLGDEKWTFAGRNITGAVWPGDPTRFRLVQCTGWAVFLVRGPNDLGFTEIARQKVGTVFRAGGWTGVKLGNFSGVGGGETECDNFSIYEVPPARLHELRLRAPNPFVAFQPMRRFGFVEVGGIDTDSGRFSMMNF